MTQPSREELLALADLLDKSGHCWCLEKHNREAIISALRSSAQAACKVTDAMCEVAIEAAARDRIQGFSYQKRHVIRDVWLPFDQQEIWSAPVAGPEEYQAFQRQCGIERTRAMLTAALALTPVSSTNSNGAEKTDGSQSSPEKWKAILAGLDVEVER